MAIALGPVSSMVTRNLYATQNARLAWCQQLSTSVEAEIELDFWSFCIGMFNGQVMMPKPSAVRVVHSDTNDTGYGGYSVEHAWWTCCDWSMVKMGGITATRVPPGRS